MMKNSTWDLDGHHQFCRGLNKNTNLLFNLEMKSLNKTALPEKLP
jgi:hypothetical protein